MVSGRMLFQGKTDDEMIHCHVDHSQGQDVRDFVPQVSQAFVLLLEKMLAKDPEHRHRDWKLVLADLNRVREGHPPWPSLLPPLGSSMRKNG